MLGFTAGGIRVSGTLIVMEFCEPALRPTYVGLSGTGVGLVILAAPLLGVWLADLGYGWLFALSIVVNLVALATMPWWVNEPHWADGLSSAESSVG